MSYKGFVATGAGLARLLTEDGQETIEFPIGHVFEMIADGDLPFREFLPNGTEIDRAKKEGP